MRNDIKIPYLLPPCLGQRVGSGGVGVALCLQLFCEPVCARGGGHDKGLHLVIRAGCVIATQTCLRSGWKHNAHVVFTCIAARRGGYLKKCLL